MTNVAVGSGLAAQLVVKDEATFGVAPSLTSGIESFEFKSETLELKKTTVVGEGLAAGRIYQRIKRRVLTNYDVTGDVVMELPTRGMNFWLSYMLGSWGQANATPAQLTTTGVYQSIHQPGGNFGHSFTLQKGVPTADNATIEPVTYVGAKLSGWEISVSTGAIAMLTLHVDARNELAGAGNSDPLNASVPALATWTPVTTGRGMELFHFREATLLSGGAPTITSGKLSLAGATPAASVKDITVGQTVALDANRIFLGANGFKAEQIENGYRAITGSFTAEWLSSEAYYNAFSADTSTSLELTFTGPIAGTSGTNTLLLDIIIPNIKLDGESPKVPGPAVITEAVKFTGYDDDTTNIPMQITYQSEDTTR